jgi:3-hydroxyisobutyrate dehydrogenase-like beta-hydroxyacid dehydrogenase
MMDAAYPIGFIGLGTMGQAMALALVKAGTRLLVWKCSGQNEKVCIDAFGNSRFNGSPIRMCSPAQV